MTSDAQHTPGTDQIVIIGAGIGGLTTAQAW
jgi:cation diffusion facilitator CzcD-associated flavoprotein CzcO